VTERRNERYLPGVELPRELKVRALAHRVAERASIAPAWSARCRTFAPASRGRSAGELLAKQPAPARFSRALDLVGGCGPGSGGPSEVAE
jgi:hypothetical protein